MSNICNMEKKKVIETDDGFKFTVNPDKLISQSEYFKSLFKYNDNSHVHISGVSGDTMKHILKYFKRKKLKTDADNIFDIFVAADYLMLDELLEEFCRVLPRYINLNNCIDLYNIAFNANRLDISDLCYCYIQVHFESAVTSADIGMLSFKHLKRLLSDSELNVDSEDLVWKAVVKWVEKDPEARIENVPPLLSCVRLEECTEECIEDMLKHPFLLEHETFSKIRASRRTTDHERATLKKRLIEAVKSLSSEPIALGPRHRLSCAVSYNLEVFWDSKEINMSVTSYDGKVVIDVPARKNFWPKFVFTSDHRIYFFAKTYRRKWEWICFDVLTSKWTTLTPPLFLYNRHRVNIPLVKVDSRIYSFSMDVFTKALLVECYDTERSVWKNINSTGSPDREGVLSLSATAHDGLIYIVGTWEDDLGYSFVIKMFGKIYDPHTDVWKEMTLPLRKSEEVAIISHSGMLLIFHFPGTFVDRSYPAEGVWKRFKNLPFYYRKLHAEVRNGLLLVFELDCGMNDEIRHSVYWDQQSEQWLDGTSLFHTTQYHTFDDPDVARKCHRLYMEDKWEKLLEDSED